MVNSLGSRSLMQVGDQDYTLFRLDAVYKTHPDAQRLPYSLKILLENLLRTEDGLAVRTDDILALAGWNPQAKPTKEIAFMPARVLLQDFTGVPAVVDLAAMREAMRRMGGDPSRINPLLPAELVIDHSVQVDDYGNANASLINEQLEFQRNRERYAFLRWGQKAFRNFKVVPPDTGIVHQVNLEYLARVVFVAESASMALRADAPLAYPDTVVGTDSHTTMINGLGVLGWGVGGIEAEAAMLGQPVSMLIPEVVGFKLRGKLREGATATDLVLTVTQMLRQKGVVGKFVEFYGPGLAELPLADRATIANMAPEYGATCGIFPVDAETLRYLRMSGRAKKDIALVEAYMKEQGLFHEASTPEAAYSDTLELDLATVEPSLAGPRRPQDRVALNRVKENFFLELPKLLAAAKPKTTALPQAGDVPPPVTDDVASQVKNGSVVIAAITSCTNTSNPSVMLAAGLLAKKAVERGLTSKPWVKTSLSPGSKVVTSYLQKAGLLPALEKLGFYVTGYGCMTCIAEGTPVLLANGTARRIEQMPSAGGAVLFSPDEEQRLRPALQAEVLPKGQRDCVRLTLQDGRTLVCTPDHEILREDGTWVQADELQPGRDRVVVGLEAPVDEIGADETGYSLDVGRLRFTMDQPQERLRLLAFARLLGHLLGDGSISTWKQGRVCVGQSIDRETVLNDIELLTGKRPAAKQYDERKWSIVLPAELTEGIASLAGVRVGRRIDQPASLPEFVRDDRCPVAVVREFLGGVFGADGHAPKLHRFGDGSDDAALEPPMYSQSAKPEHVEQLQATMNCLLHLLERCGVSVDGAWMGTYPTRRSASTYAAAQDGEPRLEVRLKLPDGLSFLERVGFRYSVDKSLRASAAAVYWRTLDRIQHQRLWMADRLRDLHRSHPDLSFRQARKLAAAELAERETIVFPYYSLLEGYDRFDRLPQPSDRKFRPLHRESCAFPSPVELLTQIGARDWFAPLLSRQSGDYQKRYSTGKTAQSLPSLTLQVIDRRHAGSRRVFDLSVEGPHSFLAGTVAVHNCIGNSGPLAESISRAINDQGLVVAAVLSGNRNFEGRVHPDVRANYLASPPLCVAYALAGRVDLDLTTEPLGTDTKGDPVYLKDIWPSQQEIQQTVEQSISTEMFTKEYGEVFVGPEAWRTLPVPEGDLYSWDPNSTYVKHPPYFEGMTREVPAVSDITGARVLAVLGDSITTDHISPAGSIKPSSPAGKYLIEHGVAVADFNSYGSRRGNHEVMWRGTFANVRLKNLLAPGTEGGVTRHLPSGETMTIFEASVKYAKEKVPLIILAGKEYGSGSSRDWAAKGPLLLGVRAVLAESYERIHRSNLVGMGILPLQFHPGENVASLGLTGEEVYDLGGLVDLFSSGYSGGQQLTVTATAADGSKKTFQALIRIDTPQEVRYYQHGGILQYVLRSLLGK